MRFKCKFVLIMAVNVVREIIASKRVYVFTKKKRFSVRKCVSFILLFDRVWTYVCTVYNEYNNCIIISVGI